MTEVIRVSVVIPTYQRCASVRRELEALAHQTMATTEYEVIVSIDGSDDGTKEMVEGFPGPYRVRAIWQPNQGRAAARNAGIGLAKGNLIVLLDDDMEPVPGFLSAHDAAHPPGSRRAVIGPVPIRSDAASPAIVQYRRNGMNAHLNRVARPGYKLGFRDVYTGNLSLPRDVLREVGGFDEAFKLYGHEDYELALRLVRAGVELVFDPHAVAHQHYDKDFAGLARDCVARGQTAVLFARKHPDIVSSLKLATYRQGSRRWRLLRSLMLLLSRRWPRFPDSLIRSITWLERRRPRRLHDYYTLALDYCFWVGARSALGEAESADRPRADSPSHSFRSAGRRESSRSALRMRIALGLLVLFAVAANVRFLGGAVHDLANVGRVDEISRYEARFRGLRHALPFYARVGYVTDPVAGDDGSPLSFKRYLLTQYALLPTIVLRDTQSALVVGNFAAPDGVDRATARGLTLIRDFGDGVALFRRSEE